MPSARAPESIYRVFGRRLRDLREERRIPQEELATLVGLTRASIANVESGKQRVFLHHLVKFAEALGVDIATLIPESEGGSLKMIDAEAREQKNAYLEKLKSIAGTHAQNQEHRTSHEKKA